MRKDAERLSNHASRRHRAAKRVTAVGGFSAPMPSALPSCSPIRSPILFILHPRCNYMIRRQRWKSAGWRHPCAAAERLLICFMRIRAKATKREVLAEITHKKQKKKRMRQRKSLLNYAHNEHQLNISPLTNPCTPPLFICSDASFFPPYLAGWPVQNDPPVPVHRLARARGAKNRRGLHRFHRTSAQNQGTVRTGWTNHCTLQVERKWRRTSITKSNLSVEVEWTAPARFFFFF